MQTLTTSRLTIRPLEDSDLEGLYAVWISKDVLCWRGRKAVLECGLSLLPRMAVTAFLQNTASLRVTQNIPVALQSKSRAEVSA